MRHKCVNNSNSMIFDKKKGMDLSKAFCHKCLLNIFCKTFHYTLVFKDASWPLVLTLIAKLIVFAFSDNLSAENSKSPAVSGNQRNQLLGCMDDNALRCQTCKYTEQIHKYSEYRNITNDEMAANPIKWYIFEKDAINDILICQTL